MDITNNTLQVAKAFLLPLVLVLLACYGFYQNHETSIARQAERLVNNIPIYSVENREWVNWFCKQPGYADPEKFLEYWNSLKK